MKIIKTSFYIKEMSKKYVDLINKYNGLKNKLNIFDIIDNRHFLVLENGKVIGGIGYKLLSWWGIEICHLVVVPNIKKD